MTRTSLSIVASRVSREMRTAEIALSFDSLIDGGEWSGPSVERRTFAQVHWILNDAGWEPDEFEQALIRATSAHWVWKSDLTRYIGEEAG